MPTPAGWYDDGSGLRRWWDGRQWTDRYLAPDATPAPSRHLWWALSPVYSCATISFIPALHAAIKLQRRDLWLWAAGLILGNLVTWALMSGGPTDPVGSSTPAQSVGASLALVLAAVGTIHAFRVRAAVFGPTLAPVATEAVDPAVARSLAARQRRQESRALVEKDPALARDLRIGRPDLTRQYDDGGLVDVNHVPPAVLVSHLGLTEEQALAVVAARDSIDGFESVDELCSLGGLPIRVLDGMRDRIVAL